MNESRIGESTIIMYDWELTERLGFCSTQCARTRDRSPGLLHTFGVAVSNKANFNTMLDGFVGEIQKVMPLDISQAKLLIRNSLAMESVDRDNIKLRVRLGVAQGDGCFDLTSCPFYKVQGEAPIHWDQYQEAKKGEFEATREEYATRATVRVDQFSLLKDFI